MILEISDELQLTIGLFESMKKCETQLINSGFILCADGYYRIIYPWGIQRAEFRLINDKGHSIVFDCVAEN